MYLHAFEQHHELLTEKRLEYEARNVDWEAAIEAVQTDMKDARDREAAKDLTIWEAGNHIQLGDKEANDAGVGDPNTTSNRGKGWRTVCTPDLVAEQRFLSMVRALDADQRLIFNHVLDSLQHHPHQQLMLFCAGGAGVGKTVLLRALYQAIARHYNRSENTDPSTTKILVTAPTGKTAFAIEGSTLHSAFRMQPNRGKSTALSQPVVEELRGQFRDLRVLIIDEI
jgi:phosphate starvation-inducible protein PhoH